MQCGYTKGLSNKKIFTGGSQEYRMSKDIYEIELMDHLNEMKQ